MKIAALPYPHALADGSSCDCSAALLMCSFGKLRYAWLNERFQKGPFWLYTEGWNRSLSFATKSTYLLGRRLANLRPAFREVVEIGGIR